MGSLGRRVTRGLLTYGMVVVLVVLVIVAQSVYPQFLTPQNIQNLLTQNASTAIVAIGATYVIICGGFDLSVSGSFGLGSVTFALLAMNGTSVPLALASAVLAGASCGLANGLVIAKLRVNTFITTLGSSTAFVGIAAITSGSSPITVSVPGFETLGNSSVFGVNLTVVIMGALYVVAEFVLRKTVFGRAIYAVGGNRETARLAGIRVDLTQTSTFIISGVLAAFAGCVLASTLSTGQFDQGGPVALDAIVAVVVGGTSLYGGEGAIWRTAIGVLMLATMNNLFSSLSVEQPTQNIVKGVVIVAAVALDALGRRQER